MAAPPETTPVNYQPRQVIHPRLVVEEEAESDRFVSPRSTHTGPPQGTQPTVVMVSREVQTTASYSKAKMTQTEGTDMVSKAIQAQEYSTVSLSVQTDPENERYKFRARHQPDEVYVKDKEVGTYFSWEQIAADKLAAEKELLLLKQYQSGEEQRTNALNDFWGNQFQELKRENTDLKEQVRMLKEELLKSQLQEFEEEAINQRASQMDLRETLRGRFYVADERILKKLDPRSYIPGDFSKSTAMSFSDRLSPVKSRRYESMSFKLDK